MYITWFIFIICIPKEEQVWFLGVKRLFALIRRWLNDLYHIKGISHGLNCLQCGDFPALFLMQISLNNRINILLLWYCIDLYRLKLEVGIITKIDRSFLCSTLAYPGNLSLLLHLDKL